MKVASNAPTRAPNGESPAAGRVSGDGAAFGRALTRAQESADATPHAAGENAGAEPNVVSEEAAASESPADPVASLDAWGAKLEASPDGALGELADVDVPEAEEPGLEGGTDPDALPEPDGAMETEASVDSVEPSEAADPPDAPEAELAATLEAESETHGAERASKSVRTEETEGRAPAAKTLRQRTEVASGPASGPERQEGGEPVLAAETLDTPSSEPTLAAPSPRATTPMSTSLTSPEPNEATSAPLPEAEEVADPALAMRLMREASGVQRAEVALEHPMFGALRMELALDDGAVDLRLLVPSLAGALRLERDEGEMRALLRDRGLRVASLDIESPEPDAPETRPHEAETFVHHRYHWKA